MTPPNLSQSSEEHAQTLRVLGAVLNGDDSEAYEHLRSHGWEYISDRYRSPEEISTLPVCKWCGQRFARTGEDNWCNEREVKGSPSSFVERPVHEERS